MSANRENFVHRAIADDFPHNAFGKITESFFRFARTEQIHLWISNAVLHHPWDESGVEIARDHRFCFPGLRIALVNIRGDRRRKTELELQQTLRRHNVNWLDIENGIAKSEIDDIVVSAEARRHSYRTLAD